MAKFALFAGGEVRQLFDEDPKFAVPVEDVSAIAGIEVGWCRHTDGSIGPRVPALDDLKRFAREMLDGICTSVITGGFTSTALGASHLYGSKTSDQANLSADLLAAAIAGSGAFSAAITCSADGGATWVAAAHTSAQVATLAADFRGFRIAQQNKRRTLIATLEAAPDAAAVAAIAWA